jgi:azurin
MKFIALFLAIYIQAHFLNAATKITITANDQMKFSVREFEVDAGKEVELVFKNEGSLPKIAMGHNLVILKEGVPAIAFGGKAL